MTIHNGIIATMYEASPECGNWVASLPDEDHGGMIGLVRSKWYWVVTADGDRLLACYPQESAYELTEEDGLVDPVYQELYYKPYDTETTRILIEHAP